MARMDSIQIPSQPIEDDIIRLEQAYKKLAEELELHYQKGRILKEEVEQAINNEQIKAVLEKIKRMKI